MSESLEDRLANRRKPGDPDYDAFYDAPDDDLAVMVPPPTYQESEDPYPICDGAAEVS